MQSYTHTGTNVEDPEKYSLYVGTADPKCHLSKISAKLIVFTKTMVKHTDSMRLS